MKAKEKAKELVDRFLSIEGADDCGNSYSYVAKQCALICVDEKIADALLYGDLNASEGHLQEVKQEIKKLQ